MSINNALNNASMGLSVTSKLADTVSNNVANAMTPGFGRRVTELTSLVLGGYGSGVRAQQTTRTEDAFLTAERRGMDAARGAASTTAQTYGRIVDALGEPGQAGALASRATTLETRLMATVSEPQSQSRLADAVSAASALASSVNAIARETVALRSEADAEISRQVQTLNSGLQAVKALNDKIAELTVRGEDVTSLQDERDRTIDQISAIIPMRTVKRDAGTVAIYGANGGMLLDMRVWELSFTRGPSEVTPDVTLGAGLGPLRQDRGDPGGPIEVSTAEGGGYSGGSLAALFETRDRIVPEFAAELDIYAQDLIDRFRDLMPATALDATGDGIFVEANPTGSTLGLASRLSLNDALTGASWRLRDGLSAAAPGNDGFGTYLQGLADAMTATRAPAGLVSQNAANSAALMASEITSFFASRSARSDDAEAFVTARQTVLSDAEVNSIGVDTDTELQALMIIEQAYAANARVLSVIDGLMQTLLEI